MKKTLEIWMISELMRQLDREYVNETKGLPDNAATEAYLEENKNNPNKFTRLGKITLTRNRLQEMMDGIEEQIEEDAEMEGMNVCKCTNPESFTRLICPKCSKNKGG